MSECINRLSSTCWKKSLKHFFRNQQVWQTSFVETEVETDLCFESALPLTFLDHDFAGACVKYVTVNTPYDDIRVVILDTKVVHT